MSRFPTPAPLPSEVYALRIAYRPVHSATYRQLSPNPSSSLSSMPSCVLVLKSRATTVLAVVVGSLIALLFFLPLSSSSISVVHGAMIDAGTTGTRVHTYIFLRRTSVLPTRPRTKAPMVPVPATVLTPSLSSSASSMTITSQSRPACPPTRTNPTRPRAHCCHCCTTPRHACPPPCTHLPP